MIYFYKKVNHYEETILKSHSESHPWETAVVGIWWTSFKMHGEKDQLTYYVILYKYYV